MSVGLSAINRELNRIPKRAEHRQALQLRDTFVDSGVATVLESIDHQVLYGRRGTGKTHALRYIEAEVQARGDVAVYADLRTLGSPDGLFLGAEVPPSERAARLLVDLLGHVHEALLAAALDDDSLIADTSFVGNLDHLVAVITTVRVSGETEISRENEQVRSAQSRDELNLIASPAPRARAGVLRESAKQNRKGFRETRRGTERIGLNFGDVSRALRDVAQSIGRKRVWLLLDEWSSVPQDIQPLLAEFLVRCVLPLQSFSVKIAAIEQQTRFREHLQDGTSIGIELGADVAANVDLDEFMVFEQNEERARSFFRGLLFKHLTSGTDEGFPSGELATERDLQRTAFTDKRAFDELVRAAEGVPRDAINIIAKAAFRAAEARIAVSDVRAAARGWFQTDKEAALRSRIEMRQLLNWIIDKVIRQKRARGFLVNQKSSGSPLLLALFDARVLHVVRRGYSAQDAPGERYDVWVIDYGAYVDLINTKSAPVGILSVENEDGVGWVDVPTQDLRAIRRAVLDLDDFANQQTE